MVQGESCFNNLDHRRKFGIAATSLCRDKGIGQEGLWNVQSISKMVRWVLACTALCFS